VAPVTVYTQHIPEQIVPGKRLGRHIRIDSRSAAYPYTAPERAIAAVLWHRNIPILDQGNLGSCTGNAITGALGCDPDWANLPAGHPVLDEAEAVALYSAATSLDAYPGAYPPDDTGSDGVSACKAAQIAGLLSGYTHCFDFPTMQQALQAGPVIIGINWYSSFDHPSSGGSVSITPDAFVRGGHEIVVRGDDASGMLLQVILDHAAKKTAVLAMGNPYVAQDFPAIQNYLCTFSNASVSEISAVRALFGEIAIHGHLPVSIPNIAQRGAGIERVPQAAQEGSQHARAQIAGR